MPSPLPAPLVRRLVREALRQRFPERYQSLPLPIAIRQLHRTARVYRDDITLIDPNTGETWPTLLPRPRPAVAPVAARAAI